MVKQTPPVAEPMRRPTICVTLSGCTVDEILADAARATAVGADICEVRLDKLWVIEKVPEPEVVTDSNEGDRRRRPAYVPPEYIPQAFDSIDLSSALDAFKGGIDLPVALTCRPERQGGYFPGSEEERISVLRAAIDSGVSWVDLEADIDSKIRSELVEIAKGKTMVISSTHFSEEPSSASEILDDIEEMADSGDIIKVCYNTTGRNSALRLFEAAWMLKESDKKTAIMGLGVGGDWTRIHAPLLNQYLVYSTMETGSHLSSEGRINTSDLLIAWEMLNYE
ncbi:MAG: type I 3-dehydroquinate dehydratase [Euryarchaeota archaeon]